MYAIVRLFRKSVGSWGCTYKGSFKGSFLRGSFKGSFKGSFIRGTFKSLLYGGYYTHPKTLNPKP